MFACDYCPVAVAPGYRHRASLIRHYARRHPGVEPPAVPRKKRSCAVARPETYQVMSLQSVSRSPTLPADQQSAEVGAFGGVGDVAASATAPPTDGPDTTTTTT